MSREVPSWDDIPESRRVLPRGLYLLTVESIDEGRSREKNKLMYKAVYTVADGPQAGTALYEYHNIGSDDDPDAEDPLTWKNAIGTRSLRDLFRACAIPMLTDMDKMCATARGQRFMQQVDESVEPLRRRDGTTNQYAGKPRNDLGPKYRVGERTAAAQPGRAAVAEILKRKASDDD